MANALQLRRGTTTEHSTFTGLVGEVTVDTTKDTVVVHDGSTAGGYPLAKFSDLTIANVVNLQTNLDAKVDLAGDTMTGFLTLSADPTSNLHASTKQYVDTSISNLVASAPATLDTLNELAAALGDDANFSTTVTNSIATKVAKAGDTMTGNLAFGDNDKAIFGAGSDLQIYHDGSHSYISDQGTGRLYLQASNDLFITNADGTENKAIFTTNGESKFFYDGSAKLATTTSGVSVTGNITVTGTVDGRDVATDGTKLDGIESGADVTDTANVTAAGALMDSELTNITAVKALNQGVATSDSPTFAGGTFTGNINTSANINFGDGDIAAFGVGSDLQIYHNGTNSYVRDIGTGNLYISGNQLWLTNADVNETYVKCVPNAAVSLFYDNSEKLLTTSTGVDVTGTITADGLDMEDNHKILLGASDDLEIYHDGSNSYIKDVGTGSLYIQASGSLSLRNAAGEDYIRCTTDNLVQIYHNNSEKLRTRTDGIEITGNLDVTGWIGIDSGDNISFSNNAHMNVDVNGATRARIEADGDFHADGDVIAYSTTISDPRLKTDIKKIEGALDKLCTLSGYTFTYTPDGKESAGVMSTEVAEVLPSAIRPKKLPLKTGDDETVYDTVQYDQLHGLLIEAIKELREEVADLKAKIEG